MNDEMEESINFDDESFFDNPIFLDALCGYIETNPALMEDDFFEKENHEGAPKIAYWNSPLEKLF